MDTTVSNESARFIVLHTRTTSMAALCYVIGCLGILGNAFVIGVMRLSTWRLRISHHNAFLLNQSVLDLLAAVFLVATTADSRTDCHADVWGQLRCKLWVTRLWLWVFLVASTYNLVALTLERYLAFIHPIKHYATFSRTKAVVMMAFPWLFGFVFNATYMIPTSNVHNGVCNPYRTWLSPTTRHVFGIFVVIIQFFMPLIILIYCYARIAFAFFTKAKAVMPPRQTFDTAVVLTRVSILDRERGRMWSLGMSVADRRPRCGMDHELWYQAHRNTIKTFIMVSITFVFCWSWNQVLFTMYNLGYSEDYASDFYQFTTLAVCLNCCTNPLIYSFQYKQFQESATEMIKNAYSWCKTLSTTVK